MSTAITRTPKAANHLVSAVLVLVPFHAFMTVWASSLVGHYTALRLWDDLLAGLLVLGVFGWLLREKPLRRELAANLVVRLVVAYAALSLLLGLISYLKHDVSLKALAYGLLVNLRYLFWFLAVAAAAQKSSWLRRNWQRLLLVPAAVVVVCAVLQFSVLPHNFLSHFGYSAASNIAPIETINHNSHYIRVQSTLRGANPLGAYLVVVLSAVVVAGMARSKRRPAYLVFGGLGLLALYATGSRSAWIGSVLAVTTAAWLQLKTKRSRAVLAAVSVLVVLGAAGAFLAFRNNTGLENTVLHTQKHSAVATSSNSAHASALKSGISDVVHQPFGDGPGTAGPASEYNAPHAPRIAENYFVQIAQETGWLGLGLLLAIYVVVGRELYTKSKVSPLALVMFASLVGLTLVNMLSHAWVDDTLSFVWWGLAGIALAAPKSAKDEV